jgi:peptidoglycan/LPS O-acetylase OafA/YrhL
MALSSQSKANIVSNLVRASAVLYLVDYYFFGGHATTYYAAIIMCIALGILMLLAAFVRKGFKWPKWVLLILTIVIVAPDLTGLLSTFHQNIYAGFISVLIDIMLLTALLLLFIPGKNEQEPRDLSATD